MTHRLTLLALAPSTSNERPFESFFQVNQLKRVAAFPLRPTCDINQLSSPSVGWQGSRPRRWKRWRSVTLRNPQQGCYQELAIARLPTDRIRSCFCTGDSPPCVERGTWNDFFSHAIIRSPRQARFMIGWNRACVPLLCGLGERPETCSA